MPSIIQYIYNRNILNLKFKDQTVKQIKVLSVYKDFRKNSFKMNADNYTELDRKICLLINFSKKNTVIKAYGHPILICYFTSIYEMLFFYWIYQKNLSVNVYHRRKNKFPNITLTKKIVISFISIYFIEKTNSVIPRFPIKIWKYIDLVVFLRISRKICQWIFRHLYLN